MDCAKCGAALPQDAAYCPRCGARAGSDEALEAAAREEMMKRRRRYFIYGLGALLLFMAVGRGFPWISFDFDDDRTSAEPPIAATATELFEAYRDNKSAARARYKDRPLVVTGAVVRLAKGPDDEPNVLMSTSVPGKNVWVDLLKRSYARSTSLKPGETIVVGCKQVIEEGRTNPWLDNCEIEDAATGAALAGPKAPSGEKPN